MAQTDRPKKRIFVIMPFESTPTRKRVDLDAFFHINLKGRIEGDESLRFQYVVSRSADTFDITDQIIRDLYESDVVLCDLSGSDPNPNVMYELGVRLALSEKPVIAFREDHSTNRRAFDIQDFYTHPYSPLRYTELEDFIIGKLQRFETGEDTFRSPVLGVVATTPSAVERIERRRAIRLLQGFLASLNGLCRVFNGSVDGLIAEELPGLQPRPEGGDLVAFLQAHRGPLEPIEWHELQFSPRPVPPLNAFLSEAPLNGILPAREEKLVNTLVAEYFIYFFASRHGWDGPNFEYVITFASESALLCHIIKLCWAYAEEPRDEKKEVWLHEIRETVKHSRLLRWGSVSRKALDDL